MQATVDLTSLRDDGDTLELDDGRTLRLRIEPDQDHSIFEDGDWYGQLEWVRKDRDYVGAYSTTRPEGFDGRARVIERDERARLWWQPPADVTDDQLPAMSSTIREILNYGYVGMILELCDGVDHYDRPIVVDSAALWGIEAMLDDAYRADVVSDLAAEVLR